MSDIPDDQKRRPPPIHIPPLQRHAPPIHASKSNTGGQQQLALGNAPSLAQQGPRSASPSLTSPIEHGSSRLPQSGSQKSRTSAITALNNLMDEARSSPRKSESGSAIVGSTTRSKHSARSRQSASSAQAQLEALGDDERTSRGKIEARTERNLFKMTGQIPPTPIENEAGKDEVIIMTQDLREQCRAAKMGKKAELQEPAKSPKKKLFGMHLPTFGRSSTPAPPMPSKAAQVLGQEPRNPTKVVVQPIMPAIPFKTPTRAPRSDTTKSLPVKGISQDTSARGRHAGIARPDRAASRRPPPKGSRSSSNIAKMLSVPDVNSSFESGPPPTPPAKDTPPDVRAHMQPASPLRRTAPSDRLRENYGASGNANMQLQFPKFALSPSQPHNAEGSGRSPTKFVPCTADEYQKLIAGEPLPWVSAVKENSSFQEQSDHGASSGDRFEDQLDLTYDDGWVEESSSGNCEDEGAAKLIPGAPDPLYLPRPDAEIDEQPFVYDDQESRQYSLLQPRFYTPSNRSVYMFADGETPSKNSDASRLLYTITSKANPFRHPEHSNNGSIEMVFEDDVEDTDPSFSTGQLVHSNNQDAMLIPARDDNGLAARVMQELQIDKQQEQSSHQDTGSGTLQPDQSSSRLTDMLHGVSPRRADYEGKFQPNCPSAVPSPLHRLPVPFTPMQAMPPKLGSSGSFAPSSAQKTLDDHFYMTNEHLDVVGKSNWDQIAELRRDLHKSASQKHAQLVATMEKHVQEIKLQVDSVNEKTDRTTEQGHNIITRLEKLFDFVKDDIMGALTAQNEKLTSTEQSVKELQITVQKMQKTSEQKISQQDTIATTGPTSNSTTSPFPLLEHRSQSSHAGYYGNIAESRREGMPSIGDHRSNGATPEAQGGHGSNYAHQWGPRNGHQGRGNKEDRSYPTVNPYVFGSNSPASGGGQYNNGYSGGYPAYAQQQPEAHYGFHQAPTK